VVVSPTTPFLGGRAMVDSVLVDSVLVDSAPRVSDPGGGRRSRKKQRTRDDLLAAGDFLFATQGFDETTTADIAERADVSQRTLFRHFPTKESLLYGDLDDARLQLRTSLAGRPDDEPILTTVRESMLSLAEDFGRNRDRRLLQARLAASSPTVSAYSRAVVQFSWEREIIAAVAARLDVDPMQDPRPEIVAGAAMSAVRIAMRQWTMNGGTDDFMVLIAAALTAIETLSELS
jgi:AcrR family transcriptional regulator